MPARIVSITTEPEADGYSRLLLVLHKLQPATGTLPALGVVVMSRQQRILQLSELATLSP